MNWQFGRVKIMKGLYFFVLLSMISLCDASSKKIQVKKTLSFSNKIPLKSIKSPDGDIIDCIHISHQPAFDHPLLKNHTILMRPSSYPGKGLFGESEIFNLKANSQNDTEAITQLWQLNGRCPEGTIPIRRNQNTSNIKRYAKKKHKSVPQFPSAGYWKLADTRGHEHAFAYVHILGKKYFGAKATINVWEPQIQDPNEFSLSQIWIIGGPDTIVDTIEAGWMVAPYLYGDNKTRLFIYWTKDAYQSTGCYNLMCPGFVQTTKRIALGAAISPVSTYHSAQYEVKLFIWKDTTHDVWWLKYGNDDVIGYWPTSLFTYLGDNASVIEWGGEVINTALDGHHTTTQMGSGHFAEEKFGGSSFFNNLQVVDESNTLRPPDGIKAVAEKPKCYNIALEKDDEWGDFFYYGGPGKNDNCP